MTEDGMQGRGIAMILVWGLIGSAITLAMWWIMAAIDGAAIVSAAVVGIGFAVGEWLRQRGILPSR